jgi:N-acetylglucosaminyldiphosphoundecaprenol N-acetyl-beta-D-mannosaminyltransferase
MQKEKNYKILDVRIDNLSQKEILEKIEGFLGEEEFHQIATVNPEFILEAQKNLGFKNILNECALNVADGFGVRCAFWRFGQHLKSRMAGADLLHEILKIAERKKLKIFLVVNKDGLSSFEEIKKAILKLCPGLQVEGENLEKNTAHCLTAIRQGLLSTDYCLLFCNFGAPMQEIFLNSQKDAKIRLAMGVGGSFDFLTGKIKRAPVFMRIIGLEWLWRIFQPQKWEYKKKRLIRVWKAVIIFLIKIIFNQNGFKRI